MAKDAQLTMSFNDLVPLQPAFFDVPDVECEDNSDKISAKFAANFNKVSIQGAQAIQRGFSQALDNAMESLSWNWPRPTSRKNGTVAGLTRNIVDTGALKSSKTTTLTAAKGGAQQIINFTYNSPYAAFVHYGGVMQPYGNPRAQSVILPGRPWIVSSLRGGNGIPAFDFKSIISSQINSAFR